MTLVSDAKSTQNSTKTCKPSGIFACFSKLPFELRRKIWIFALPGPRPIFMKSISMAPNISDYYMCATATPALLHTSNESREVALEFYELSFRGITKGHPMYTDFQMNILYLKGWASGACLRVENKILDAPFDRDGYLDTPKDQDHRYIEENVRCIVFDYSAAPRLIETALHRSCLYKFECIVIPDPEAGSEGLSYRWYDFDNRLELLKNASYHYSRVLRRRAVKTLETWKSLLKDGEKPPGILLVEAEVLKSIALPTTTR